MTKAEFISYVKNLLPKIDKTRKYHDNVVSMAIDMATEQIFHDMYLEDSSNLDQYVKIYEDQVIKYDDASNRFYIDLPVSIYNLPKKSRGVMMIKNQGVSNTKKYMPATEYEFEYMDSEIGYMSSIAPYSVHVDKIWFSSSLATEANKVFEGVSGVGDITSQNYTIHGLTDVGTLNSITVTGATWSIVTSSVFSVKNIDNIIVQVIKETDYTSSDSLTVTAAFGSQASSSAIDISSGVALATISDLEYDLSQSRNTTITIAGTNSDSPETQTGDMVVSIYVA